MRYKTTKEELEDAVKKSKSVASVCRILNIRPVGGNYKTLKIKFKEWGIDTSHFTGQGWNVGLLLHRPNKGFELSEILVKDSTYTNTTNLKEKLINKGIKEHKCECCGLTEWNEKPIPIELNHINGENTDNRIENLEIICPNCHAQTPTYRRKNKKSAINKTKKDRYEKYKNTPVIVKVVNNCIVCGSETENKYYCSTKCYKSEQSKNIPTIDEILESFKTEKSFCAVGRKYDVSDNAVRKWCKNYGILDSIKKAV